ncbi:TOBE domain-containing protein [Methanoregula formicica]|uniref:TOBE domain-containing protein n=1 Tax=Methanoregula formicica TaxID=882104 RepID=UPI0009FBA0EC|nr:TOBE domain-containing protein [Methanoregula formicica]
MQKPVFQNGLRSEKCARKTEIILPRGTLGYTWKNGGILNAGIPLTALLTHESCRELDLEQGGLAYATFKATAVHVIPLNSTE